MSTHPVYEEVLQQVKRLSPEEQTRLTEETMNDLIRLIKTRQLQPIQEEKKAAL